MRIRLSLLALAIVGSFSLSATPPNEDFKPLMLAKDYQPETALEKYWVSEKLDGIRAYWDGVNLKTRNGHVIHAPKWFTQTLPSFPVEGELWAGRGRFHVVQTTVMDTQADDIAWRNIGFYLFDLPHDLDTFDNRYARLSRWLESSKQQGDYSHLALVEQYAINSEVELNQKLLALSEKGAEGLMLKRIDVEYQSGRTDALLKLKTYQDREAVVIGYKAGKGKYKGQVGALLVRNSDGVEFYLGSGLSDQLRDKPPSIGTTVTYRFNGLTQYGKPKYARLLRERPATF
ncbi:DNA ligase [Vibrio astriarenae]|uniref:DNA ligase n=1 Tax=Vibrio astriarenae TaxID=1481923 RepID=A0A7Z2T342_9VIBR|nr:DNA ligase [Vibrio astriarenae]QIA63375.1 DNA ligase [Vibrio astriarenae]